ncbi:hypothetical protein Tco_0039446 [Tanacetum coccineum]
MSATEAEYIAASEAGMEAVWIRKFISGLEVSDTTIEVTFLMFTTVENLEYPVTKAYRKESFTQILREWDFISASSSCRCVVEYLDKGRRFERMCLALPCTQRDIDLPCNLKEHACLTRKHASLPQGTFLRFDYVQGLIRDSGALRKRN